MSGISNGRCLPTCSTTTRTGLILDSTRTRHRAGLRRSDLGLEARFNPCRDSAACTIVMRRPRRLKNNFCDHQTLSLVTRRRHRLGVLHGISTVAESVGNPKLKRLDQIEEILLM